MIFDLYNASDCDVLERHIVHVRERKQRVGLVSGSFDLIHFHHFLYLNRCRRMCDVLIVGVDSDELVRERKGPKRPVIYDLRRLVMVDGLKPVAFAFIMGSIEDFGKAAVLVRPDIIFKNDAFEGKEETILGHAHAGRVVIVKDVVDHASTGAIMNAAAERTLQKPS